MQFLLWLYQYVNTNKCHLGGINEQVYDRVYDNTLVMLSSEDGFVEIWKEDRVISCSFLSSFD